jgi:Tfp pilus assembly protein FimT
MKAGRRSRLGRRDGTTIAELLAVVAVLGTFLGTTMLTSNQVRPLYIVRGAARQVASELQKARMAAATENNRYVVRFTTGQTFTVLDDNNNDGLTETGETVNTVTVNLDWPGVTFSSTGTITFRPDGTASAPVTITLQKTGTTTKTVTISQAGSIRIQ